MPKHIKLVFITLTVMLTALVLYWGYSEFFPLKDKTLSSEEVLSPLEAPLRDSSSFYEKTLKVKGGETLAQILENFGCSRQQAHEITSAIAKHFNLKSLKAGQDLHLQYQLASNSNKAIEFLHLDFRPCLEFEVSVDRKHDGSFEAKKINKKLVQELKSFHGHIKTSLFADANKLGVPHQVICEVSDSLSFDVHLQKDLQENDPFEGVYENIRDEQGHHQKPGHLIYAAIGVQEGVKHIYRFKTSDGYSDLYNDKGESVRKALLVTPIAAARLSSGFGLRQHPVHGFTKLHKGVDFAAPIGTPIKASGNGRVEFVGHRGGYGKYIIINHANGYMTAYAHLSKFAGGMQRGSSVKQGQVIGFVGATGLCTGPHLHYEVIFNGKHINPQKIKQPPRTKLAGNDLKAFLAFKKEIQSYTQGLKLRNRYAHNHSSMNKKS